MKKTRIKEISIDGVSKFYPQYLSWLGGWHNYAWKNNRISVNFSNIPANTYKLGIAGLLGSGISNEQPEEEVFFETLEAAQNFISQIEYKKHKPTIKTIIHNN